MESLKGHIEDVARRVAAVSIMLGSFALGTTLHEQPEHTNCVIMDHDTYIKRTAKIGSEYLPPLC